MAEVQESDDSAHRRRSPVHLSRMKATLMMDRLKRLSIRLRSPRMLSAMLTAGVAGALALACFAYGGTRVAAELKTWQTLMAALVALAAATIAYRAAVLKIEFDREKEHRDLLRVRLGVFLRLQAALAVLLLETETCDEIFTYDGSDKTVTGEDLIFLEPPEIGEAWAHLDLFPKSAILDLSSLKRIIRWVSEEVTRLGPNKIITFKSTPRELNKYWKAIQNLRIIIQRTQNTLGDEILQIKPD